VDECRVVGAVD